MKLDEFLQRQHVPFRRLSHRPAFTANRIAQLLHVPGKEMAKCVLVRTTHGYMLAVLPSTHNVDLNQLKQELGEETVELAAEDEAEQLFVDCDRGAMPPFGSLYKLPTLVDETLTEDEEIVFESQSHEEAIRMRYRDYEAIEHPRMGHFAARVVH